MSRASVAAGGLVLTLAVLAFAVLAFAVTAFAVTAAAAAERRITAAEFEAYVTGHTLYYAGPGQEPYGAEQYLAGRRVLWSFLDGDCVPGFWYEKTKGLICFVYEADDVETQCWTFWAGPDGIRAHFANEPRSVGLFELRQSDEPLDCPGPQVGA